MSEMRIANVEAHFCFLELRKAIEVVERWPNECRDLPTLSVDDVDLRLRFSEARFND